MSKPFRQKRVQASKTPIRAALKADSPLQRLVSDGLGAVITAHRNCFDDGVRSSFMDSLDVDRALKEGREQEHRWDYLLGHQSRKVFGVEPHTAQNSEITTVINKVIAARRQLGNHLRNGALVSKWFWVASGRVQFSPMEKATFRLAQNGIEFVGKSLKSKHIR